MTQASATRVSAQLLMGPAFDVQIFAWLAQVVLQASANVVASDKAYSRMALVRNVRNIARSARKRTRVMPAAVLQISSFSTADARHQWVGLQCHQGRCGRRRKMVCLLYQ